MPANTRKKPKEHSTKSFAHPQTKLNKALSKTRFLRQDDTSFWTFLKENNISYDKSHFPFLTYHSQPQLRKVYNFPEYLHLGSRGSALAYLYQGFGKALDYVGPVLDLEREHGFNDHTDRHTLWVTQNGVELLQRAGVSYDGRSEYGAKSEVLMTLVGMTHDLGNFLSRKEHSTYSAWLLTKMFDKWQEHPYEFNHALYAILFHEEPVLIALDQPLEKGTPLQWALVAADKMHVGRERIGDRSFASGVKHKALEKDKHIFLNALIVRSSWHVGVEEFVWHLDFSVEQLEKKFESFTKGNNRIWMPGLIQRLFIQKGVRYRDSFATMFNEIYGDRMKLAAKSIFLLYPFVKKFRVELSDNDTRAKVGSGAMTVWERGRD